MFANIFKIGESGQSGLGGWLIIVGFGLIFGIFLRAYNVFDYINVLTNANLSIIPGLLPVMLIELAAEIAFTLISAYLLYLFFKKRKKFPMYFILLLWSLIAWVLADYFMLSSLSAPTPELQQSLNDSAYEGSRQILKTFVSSILWISYMHKSERVKATFIK